MAQPYSPGPWRRRAPGGEQPRTIGRLAGVPLARREGVFDDWHERVFAAYFSRGLDISEEEVLRGVGEEAGLDPDDVSDAVCRGDFADVVDTSKDEALDLGIGGTPAFLFDGCL